VKPLGKFFCRLGQANANKDLRARHCARGKEVVYRAPDLCANGTEMSLRLAPVTAGRFCWFRPRELAPLAIVVVAVLGVRQRAAASEPPPELEADALQTVLVSVTPVLGTGIPINHVPSNVQTLRATQIEADHAEAVTDLVDRHFASISLADTEGSPFQQDLVERGFSASPVLGTPQGLAIYQNGARLNEAFGDTVLWDFIPVFAIEELQELPGSNPVFGLNALGGAVLLEMKNGFDAQGSSAEITAGSFGRVRATAQAGIDRGDSAFYIGANASHEHGWRQLSSSDLVQGFADYAIRRDDYKFGASLTLATSTLNGNGADPAQDDRTAAFAIPDTERNRLAFFQLRGSDSVTEALALQGTAYFRYIDLQIENGGASGFSQCGQNVCDDSGPLLLLDGSPVPLNVPYSGTLPVQTTQTNGTGGALQATFNRSLGGMRNVANFGASFDQGVTHFSNATYLGKLVYLSPPGTTTDPSGLLIGGIDYNIRLDTVNRYYGLFFTDTLSVTDAINATVTSRFNLSTVQLSDRFGNLLNGDHSYDRLNPSAGVTYQAASGLNLYASYSEANRIPTAAELSCADPTQPCRFPLGFISDPNLDQVVARTVELGARGHAGGDLALDWFADVYDTRNRSDIIFVSSGPLIGSGYFRNAGATQRPGAEVALYGTWRKFEFHANYGFVRATFESRLTIASENNPGADANGNIFVQPGDRLPEVPLHSAKFGAGYSLARNVHVALDAVLVSGQYLRGDEANLQKELPGYTVLNARASWQATHRLSVFFEGENILNRRFDSFGLHGDPTGNGAFPQFTNPRFYTPGQPFGVWLGAQIHF
jgi:iron complex outermembrane receptor protein